MTILNFEESNRYGCWWRDIAVICSLEAVLTHPGSTTWIPLLSVWGSVGSFLLKLNQNRHKCTSLGDLVALQDLQIVAYQPADVSPSVDLCWWGHDIEWTLDVVGHRDWDKYICTMYLKQAHMPGQQQQKFSYIHWSASEQRKQKQEHPPSIDTWKQIRHW